MAADIYSPTAHDALSLQELELYHAIMDYRAGLGLDPVPLSRALTTTAGRHVVDTRQNIWGEDLDLPRGTNLHSWSDARYYADNRDPEVMWFAPERLGTGYASPAYEITAAGTATVGDALELWRSSPAHDAIIANRGPWSQADYAAIGVGVETSPGAGPYAGRVFHVWFGEAADASGPPNIKGTGGGDRIEATRFVDRVFGNNGADSIFGKAGADRLSAGADDDRVWGGNGHDRIYGGSGEDELFGGRGGDRMLGGQGADALHGGTGGDRLIGGPGADLLEGGRGADVFEFLPGDAGSGAERDVIVDFERGTDRIDLGAFDAFDFIDDALFSGEPGELRFSNGMLRSDLDGDGRTDFQIELDGIAALSAADLLL